MTPSVHHYHDIREDQKIRFKYRFDETIFGHFLEAFQDTNPLHTDDDYARLSHFKKKVMHGAILNGFLSHFIGVVFPGKFSLLHSIHIQYKEPNYIGDEITVEARVAQKVDALKVVVLDVNVLNLTSGQTSAKAKIQVGLLQ